jgi:hypothetical protein
MNSRKRLHALILCAGFILVLLVSSAFLIHEADHDCSGEDCPICRTIAMTTMLMRVCCMLIAAWLFTILPAAAASARKAPEGACIAAPGTPVSLKTRMND